VTSGLRSKLAYGRILVVEDEPLAFRNLERIVARYRPVRHARRYSEAISQLHARKDWCGFMFDVMLEGQDRGLELLELVSEEYPGVPAMILTAIVDPAIVNRGAQHGATVVSKPLGEQELLPFLQRVISREHGFARDFAERLDGVSRLWKMSPREHEILAWFVAGGSREGYLSFTGMAETTLKTHVKHMCAKTQKGNLSDLVASALRRVVVGRGQSDLPPRAAAIENADKKS
jgi:DNA-binding NarL/FixJ family response regulator